MSRQFHIRHDVEPKQIDGKVNGMFCWYLNDLFFLFTDVSTRVRVISKMMRGSLFQC